MNEPKKLKILTSARSVFLRYGYRRVNMSEIANAADISRPALYLVFKSKEEIFIGVYLQWVRETVAEISAAISTVTTPKEKIERAFEIWSVRPFELMLTSPEARELMECSFDFAQDAFRQGYKEFEAALVPTMASLADRCGVKLAPAKIAHVFVSAVRGFKQAATTSDELRQLIKELLTLSFKESRPGVKEPSLCEAIPIGPGVDSSLLNRGRD